MIPLFERFLPEFEQSQWQHKLMANTLVWDSVIANCQRILTSTQTFHALPKELIALQHSSWEYGLDAVLYGPDNPFSFLEKLYEVIEQQLLVHEPRLEKATVFPAEARAYDFCEWKTIKVTIQAKAPLGGARYLTLALKDDLRIVEVV